MFFKEVVDLGHELFNNMAGISATSMAAFWPSDTHARSSKISQGELARGQQVRFSGLVQAHSPAESRAFAPVATEGTGERDSPPEGTGFEPLVPPAGHRSRRGMKEAGCRSGISE